MNDWQKGTLEDLAEIIMGQSPPGETYNTVGDGAPMLNCKFRQN
jgi:type I restriction enzyme S subunit